MHAPDWPIAERINAERLVLLGWSRAILMQMAHPLIAAGVADHSAFRASPLTSARRLHQTVRAMLGLTFGTDATRAKVVADIRAIHRRVRGTLRATVGPFPAGTAYSADDPALLLWVHATVLDSSLLAYEKIVAPLTAGQRDAYCRDAAGVAIALGAREDQVPTDHPGLVRYITAMLASGDLAVGDDARAIATAVLRGRLPTLTGPVAWANRRLTAGWLPPTIRDAYGLRWRATDQRQFTRLERLFRGLRRTLPTVVALWPDARRETKGQRAKGKGQR